MTFPTSEPAMPTNSPAFPTNLPAYPAYYWGARLCSRCGAQMYSDHCYCEYMTSPPVVWVYWTDGGTAKCEPWICPKCGGSRFDLPAQPGPQIGRTDPTRPGRRR